MWDLYLGRAVTAAKLAGIPLGTLSGRTLVQTRTALIVRSASNQKWKPQTKALVIQPPASSAILYFLFYLFISEALTRCHLNDDFLSLVLSPSFSHSLATCILGWLRLGNHGGGIRHGVFALGTSLEWTLGLADRDFALVHYEPTSPFVFSSCPTCLKYFQSIINSCSALPFCPFLKLSVRFVGYWTMRVMSVS